MNKIKQILDAYYDGIYHERETLYRIAEILDRPLDKSIDANPHSHIDGADLRGIVNTWLDGDVVSARRTIKQISDWIFANDDSISTRIKKLVGSKF